MIAIITVSNDLHALEIQTAVKKMGYNNIHIIEIDKMSHLYPLSLSFNSLNKRQLVSILTANDGLKVNIEECETIWVRRPKANQNFNKSKSLNANESEYINNECKGGIGALLSSSAFSGRWVSNPENTIKASDKLFQLQIAQKVGFTIPNTIISQSREEVIEFYKSCNKKIIAKPIIGISEPFLITQQVKNPYLLEKKAFSACPTIYQQLIEGTKHIRLNSFGQYKIAALIESQDLDWRPNLNIPISKWDIPKNVIKLVDEVLEKLGLAMGVFDFKLTKNDELIWFEVNPQGQFLFLEPFLKENISNHFAKFLIGDY